MDVLIYFKKYELKIQSKINNQFPCKKINRNQRCDFAEAVKQPSKNSYKILNSNSAVKQQVFITTYASIGLNRKPQLGKLYCLYNLKT